MGIGVRQTGFEKLAQPLEPVMKRTFRDVKLLRRIPAFPVVPEINFQRFKIRCFVRKIIGLELRDFRRAEHSARFIVRKLAQHMENGVFPIAEKPPFRRKLPPDGNGSFGLHAKLRQGQRGASALAQSCCRAAGLQQRFHPCTGLLF